MALPLKANQALLAVTVFVTIALANVAWRGAGAAVFSYILRNCVQRGAILGRCVCAQLNQAVLPPIAVYREAPRPLKVLLRVAAVWAILKPIRRHGIGSPIVSVGRLARPVLASGTAFGDRLGAAVRVAFGAVQALGRWRRGRRGRGLGWPWRRLGFRRWG